MKFTDIADTYTRLERITSGNEIRNNLSFLFKKVPRVDIKKVAYLTTGRIASDYEPIDLGIAGKMAERAIAQASGTLLGAVVHAVKKTGDHGDVAATLARTKKPSLTVNDVFKTLHDIAATKGLGSQERKITLLATLLSKATPTEARYLVRMALGKLRLGVGDKTVLDSLAIAYTGNKADKKHLEHAYNIAPDIGVIAETLAKKGLADVKNIGVVVGRPIQMMLCQRVKTIEDVSRKMRWPVVVEEKYDGERIQAHKRGRTVTLFSRRLENITSQFPDIVDAIKKQVKAQTAVIEGEAMPIDAKGNILPFQVLMSRRRKHDIAAYVKKIPVCWYVFDLLSLNGKNQLGASYPKRQAALKRIIKPNDRIKLALNKTCRDTDCIEELFNRVVELGGEGVVIKSTAPDSTYQAGVRGWHWIKWKPEYAKKLRDTFDLVVVGAYSGRGKRAGRYGALLCAAYNGKTDRYETFCKLGTGFTDADLARFIKIFASSKMSIQPRNVSCTKSMTPDVWFKPNVVVEVTGAQITRSPNHTVGLDHGQGLALRFPRFLRIRHDKKPAQATTIEEIRRMAR